jgi:hypothetical protein
LEIHRELEQVKSATKADDAKIPVYIWNEQVDMGDVARYLDVIRSFLLRWWCWKVL